MTQPNIVYLHSHDTGRFIQPYGHAVPTPNLQRLAEDGVLFRQAFCAAPTWMQETNDPLLQGPVPAPRGAKVNDAAGRSPREEPHTID